MRAPLSIYHIWILLVCALSSTDIAILLQNQPNASDVEEIIIKKKLLRKVWRDMKKKNNNKKAAVKNVRSISVEVI